MAMQCGRSAGQRFSVVLAVCRLNPTLMAVVLPVVMQ